MRQLLVLTQSDSFSELWPTLASDLGVELQLASSAAEAEMGPDTIALLVVAAGREEEAEPVLRALPQKDELRPLVVGTSGDYHVAVTLMRGGAEDYFALPQDLERLRSELRERVRRRQESASRGKLVASQRTRFDFGRIIGESEPLRAALDRAAKIIPRDLATVLITGETGTGKELLAQAIHYNGPRAAGPFVEVNCTAIPKNLLESELFGHEKGAFTDARTSKPGLFEAADGGTVFLDEIGHLPYELQGKILKVLEEKQVRRVGGLKTASVDVRILAATHVDLAAAVRKGEFREDLYYRLSVIPIHLPPLRERGEDVILLAEHFLSSLASRYGISPPVITPDIRRSLRTHPWPGNVRELRNGIERALLLGEGDLEPTDLFPETAPAHAARGTDVIPFPASIAEMEIAAAHAMVAYMEGNKKAAAGALGISRAKLYRLLEAAPRVSGEDTVFSGQPPITR